MKPIDLRRSGAAALLSSVLVASWCPAADYSQDFTAPDGSEDLGDGSALQGNFVFTPQVQGNQLQLITNASNNNSAFHIPPVAGSAEGWAVTFDFTITDTTNNGPGEGFSFSYGAIPFPPSFAANSTRAEEGWPGRTDVLSFEIDIAANGSDEVGPAIGLNRPSSAELDNGSIHESSLAFTNGDALADDGTVSGTATISWFPGAGASFSTTGLLTNADFSFVPTPGFSGDDGFTFAIAGRTSGSNAEVRIDNLEICTGNPDTDNDGLPDSWELANGLDPNSSVGDDGASGDPDTDTLTNLQEYNLGTKANDPDSDADGLRDNVESGDGTWTSASDTGTDPLDPDSDGDQLLDGVESCSGTFVDLMDTGTDPNNPNTDGDGQNDFEESTNVARDPNVADDPDPDRVYIQDFTGVPNGTTELNDGTAFAGSAVVWDEALRLTTNDNSLSGAFHIPARVDSSTGFTITFDYTIMDTAGTNNPADGFAFSYGSLPFGQTSSVAEEGFPGAGSVLSFEMDTWDAASDWGPSIGVDRPAASQGTVAETFGPLLRDGEEINGQIVVTVLPDGTSSFTSTGAITNADFQNVVTGFTLDDDFTFGFSARTGGANEEVLIDNIELTTGILDSDGDGLADTWEISFGLDPFSAEGDDGAAGDPDSDGLANIDEQASGTSPISNDTDMDGLLDNVEDGGGSYVSPSQTGTSPVNGDSDGDGLADGVEDNGGTFVSETQTGTDPNNDNTDGDSVSDGGEVILNPIIGRDPTIPDDPVATNRYTQNFDPYPDGTTELGDLSTMGSTNNESAQVVDGQLRLTEDGVGSTRSYFRIPALSGSSQGWTATFDFTLTDGPGANDPADGFNFSYGAIPAFNPDQTNVTAPDAYGAAEEGWPGVEHLSFEIDTWMNGDAEVGVNIASEIGGVPTDHAFENGNILPDGGMVSGTATISWNPQSGATFITTGLVTNAAFENVEIPGFMGDDSYIFAFGTRTGGAHEDLFIDNIVITTGGQKIPFDLVAIGDDLEARWESRPGRFYQVVTSLDLQGSVANPADWPVLIDNIVTTPPENVELFARPADPERYYAIVERPIPALFEDDFETDQGWIVVEEAGHTPGTTWERGTPGSPFGGPIEGAGGSANCYSTVLLDNYLDGANVSLRSPVIDLTAYPSGTEFSLEFMTFRDFDGQADFGSISVVEVVDPANPSLDVPLGEIATDIGLLGLEFDQWARIPSPNDADGLVDPLLLPDEANGKQIRLRFNFFSDNNGVTFSGWHIDDVKLDFN